MHIYTWNKSEKQGDIQILSIDTHKALKYVKSSTFEHFKPPPQ